MFLFGFQRFIAPTVIKFFYYISLVLTIFGALGMIVYALVEVGNIGGQQSAAMILGAAVGAPVAILLMRFTTEMWLVIFEINSRLGQIRDKM
ncbi:MAG: DUF4282 domain-containing protein [Pseudomonadota bacterium]|nr:DUF4282 domain-containing protein [Pseudomonadota bacterium]